MMSEVAFARKVIEAIPRATRILLEQDLEGADYLIQSDDEIDARCIEIEDRCYHILALQAPVATDLRAVISAFKMTAEIDRKSVV